VGHGEVVVVDTHALVWWILSPSDLGAAARETFERDRILLSAISCMEIASLVRRKRVYLNAPVDDWMADVQSLPNVTILPVTVKIAVTAAELPDDIVRDPADRLIVATAILHGLPLVTKDQKITASNLVRTIW
jgi:PIN domain nuclease of toxin-antitoxin system